METVTGRVIDTRREGHTVYGNPIMSIALDAVPGKWFRISDNASIVYAITNPEYAADAHTFRLTRAGRIYAITREGRND